jgi:hypothetical protein
MCTIVYIPQIAAARLLGELVFFGIPGSGLPRPFEAAEEERTCAPAAAAVWRGHFLT